MKSVIMALLLALGFGFAPALAESSPSERVQTENDLLERALAHNPELLAAQEGIAMARADYRRLQAELWPWLSFNSQSTAGSNQRMSMPVPGIEPANMSMRPPGLTANLNLTALYPLFTGGKVQAQLEGGKRRLEQSEAEYQSKRLEVQAEVQQLQLLRRMLSAQQRVLHQELKRLDAALSLAEERYRLGKDPYYILLRVRSEQARRLQELNNNRLQQEKSLADLRRWAALPPQTLLPPLPELEANPSGGYLPSLHDAGKLALQNTPQLRVFRSMLGEAETRVQIAQASYFPFVYLVGVAELRVPERPEMDYSSGVALDLLISLPVFDGFRRDAEVERLKREASQLQNRLNDAQNRLQAELLKEWHSLQLNRANLELSAQVLSQSEEEFRIAQLRYHSGKAILLEWLDAANQLRQARLAQLENSYNFQIAQVRFEQLLALPEPAQSQPASKR
ncbi:MAG: TolC family protein [Candidatus Sericytochromatia bacterium]|nr:TolC family protein [Candidatus Sericytochromatia bacterium]